MGILRTDRVAGLGGANAIKGSVEFRADQNIQAEIVNGNADFNYGSGDFTIECWWNSGGDLSTDINFVTLWNYSSSRQAWGMYWDADDGNFGLIASTGGDIGSTDITYRQAAGFEKNRWYHLAIVRISNTLTLYKDGTSIGSNSSFTGTIYENTVDPLIIGGQMDGTSESAKIMRGFISNLRIIKGEGIYTGNFTPPTNELTVTPNTVLLACQSPGDILHEATGKKLIAYRRTANSSFPVASRFTPNSPVGFSTGFSVGITTISDPGTQFGSTFDGVTTFDSQAYMVPPAGNTRERNRGRAVISGGREGHAMQFINIQSQGNSQEFGDSITGDGVEGYATGSSVRGLFSGTHPSCDNVIEFITFAAQSNGTDFGDTTEGRRSGAGLGNNTRGIFCGGIKSNAASTNIMDFVTFTTLGNATDFGDMTVGRDQLAGVNDTTRGCLCGGVVQPGSHNNTIDFITTATTGNAQDFGDMENGFAHSSGASGKTRGLMATGYSPNFNTNINFITIQTTGNTKDFGDLLQARSIGAGMSNSIRGVYAGGYNPSPSFTAFNIIDFVNIESTGNALDFGDLSLGANYVLQATSDSHGGLSE